MTTSTATAGRSENKLPGSGILHGIRNAGMGIAAYIRDMRRSRETYMALRNLDDHMLKDIGMSRADIVDLETFGRGR